MSGHDLDDSPLLDVHGPVPYGSPESKAHELSHFPVIVALGLHYLTFGAFTAIWLPMMHGRMPRIRRDDPSTLKALLYLLIPLFDIYWLLFSHLRLCDRINEQRSLRVLPRCALKLYAVLACLSILAGAFSWQAWALASYLTLVPLYLFAVQSAVNELVVLSYLESLADSEPKEEGSP